MYGQYPVVGGTTIADPNKVLQNTLANGPEIASKVSPLQRALNEQGEQIETLNSLLAQLTDQLTPVRVQAPMNEETQGVTASTPAMSLHVEQLTMQVSRVKDMQYCVRMLMEELEV
jgi:hypothetical protein